MSKLIYTQIQNFKRFNISFNNKELGSLNMLEDGLYYYFPINFNGSCLSSWVLKDIYLKLDELNNDYEKMIDDMLKEEQ